MLRALRLQAITLPVPDLEAAEKFYRWVLAMKGSADEPTEKATSLGWGREDRLRLLDARMDPLPREAIELRMEASDPAGLGVRLAAHSLAPTRVLAFAGDAAQMRETWPDVELALDSDPASSNRFVVSLEAPADVRVDLYVPLPASAVIERGRHGPFYRRTRDWRGLENPGLLGLTLGARDVATLTRFFASLGIAPMEGDDERRADESRADLPLLAGDHQIRVEKREPPGIYGAAFVVAASRLPDLVRTLERFGAQHRHERNHLLAVDPSGRILVVNGVRSG